MTLIITWLFETLLYVYTKISQQNIEKLKIDYIDKKYRKFLKEIIICR